MVERIECLYGLRVHERLTDFPDDLLRRHARRLAGPPTVGRGIDSGASAQYRDGLLLTLLPSDSHRPVADDGPAPGRRPLAPRRYRCDRHARCSGNISSRDRMLLHGTSSPWTPKLPSPKRLPLAPSTASRCPSLRSSASGRGKTPPWGNPAAPEQTLRRTAPRLRRTTSSPASPRRG
jgi:hypothetical protein